MRYILLLLLFACNNEPQPKESVYYLELDGIDHDLLGNKKNLETDTIMCFTDSIAYWRGTLEHAANLQVAVLLKERNIPYSKTITGFRVLDSNFVNIETRISASHKTRCNEIIEEKQNELLKVENKK